MSQYSRQPDQQNQLKEFEQQKFKQSQINAEEQILKYTIRQDFLNVLGIAADFQAGLELYENDKNLDQIITMLHNKLILQINLSSSIHYDQQQQYQKSPHMKSLLEEEKLQIKQFLLNILQQKKFLPQIEEYFKIYLNNCLGNHPTMLQQQLKETRNGVQFNQENLQKIFGSIQQTDKKYSDLQSGKTKANELSEYEIEKHIEQRKKNAQNKLQNNNKRECRGCQLI